MTADLPKVELHLHLEGAAPPALIRDIAREKHIDLSGAFDARGDYVLRDFAHFVRLYEAVSSVLTTPRDYARLLRAVLENSAENGVIYCETFVPPDFCGGRDVAAWRDYVSAMAEVAAEAERDLGITCRAIGAAIRRFGPDRARGAALCAAETSGSFLCGFGLVGDERIGAAADFAWAFDLAREAGLGLTCHAGEFAGPEAVRAAIRDLRLRRIGHGVRAIEDLALVDEIAEAGIVLEICPGSNVAMGLYPSVRAHPIGRLHQRGVRVTVSTDDPPFFRTSMRQEYDRLAEAFDWDEAVFRDLARTAAEAAFCDAPTRAAILAKLT